MSQRALVIRSGRRSKCTATTVHASNFEPDRAAVPAGNSQLHDVPMIKSG